MTVERTVAKIVLTPGPNDTFRIRLSSELVEGKELPGEGFTELFKVYGMVREFLDGRSHAGRTPLDLDPVDGIDLLTDIREAGRVALVALVGPLRAGPAQTFR